MKNRVITLVDVGHDSSFDASMSFVQSTLQNINAGWEKPIVDIGFVRSRDLATVVAAMTSPCSVLHVMAHGDHATTPSFTSSDGETTIHLSDLGAAAAQLFNSGISTGAVLADGCKTGIGVWQKAIRDCLQGPIAYIGTSKVIGWHESTVFCAAFYGSLFRNKGRGQDPAQQANAAATRAIEAYEVLTDTACPFKVVALEPSRLARRAFNL